MRVRKRGIYIVCMRESKWTNKYETNNCDWLCMMRRRVSCISDNYLFWCFERDRMIEWNEECMLTRVKTNVNGYRHVVNFQSFNSNLIIISFLFKNLLFFLLNRFSFLFYKIDHLFIYWFNNVISPIYYKIYIISIINYILLDCCNLI